MPGSTLKIVADEFSPNLVREQRFVASQAPDAAPSALLRLSSKMAGQTLDVPLALKEGQPAENDFFGLARIVFRPTVAERRQPPVQETQMVFANYAPIVQPDASPFGYN